MSEKEFDLEKFIINALKSKKSTADIVVELEKLGITKSRKSINNKIASMRSKGIEVPYSRRDLAESSSEKDNTTPNNEDKKFKRIEENIFLMPIGKYKVSKSIKGKVYQKICKTLEQAKEYRDSLTKEESSEATAQKDFTSEEVAVLTNSKAKRPYNKKENKPTLTEVSDLFETNNGSFVVILSKDKEILSTLISRVLG